jgi:hypothetical protein
MRQFIIPLLLVLVLLSGCNTDKKEAQARLDKAKALYAQNEYAAAKTEIDSLRTLYPKALDALREGLTLMREIEMSESERNIHFVDSLLPIRQKEAEELMKAFVYEKDSAYNDIGTFIYRQQTIERNLERCYIRSGVNEKGEMYLASVFYGPSALKHTGIRVSTPDSLFAETASIPYDGGVNYRFENLGNTTEVVTYNGDNGLDAIKFIYANKDKRIRVQYTGGNPYVIYIADNDKKAIAATYEFAVVLSDIEQMSNEKDKSLKRIDYLKGRLNTVAKEN